MSFITNADLIIRIGGTKKAAALTTESGSVPDTAMIDAIIAEAEGTVFAALRTRTSVTITLADHPKTWALLAGVTMSLVIYGVAKRRPPVPDDWTADRENAIATLKKIEDGTLDLPDVTLNATETGHGNWRVTANPEAML